MSGTVRVELNLNSGAFFNTDSVKVDEAIKRVKDVKNTKEFSITIGKANKDDIPKLKELLDQIEECFKQ